MSVSADVWDVGHDESPRADSESWNMATEEECSLVFAHSCVAGLHSGS